VVLYSPISGPAPAKLLCKWPTKVGMVHSDRGGSSMCLLQPSARAEPHWSKHGESGERLRSDSYVW
jgi:hypothetical protein